MPTPERLHGVFACFLNGVEEDRCAARAETKLVYVNGDRCAYAEPDDVAPGEVATNMKMLIAAAKGEVVFVLERQNDRFQMFTYDRRHVEAEGEKERQLRCGPDHDTPA